ncbi:MAG: 8-oxo-(d)GTP phosphatase [Pseudonocardiales bacterium]|nr:8-oxo-(d)GTP phosphatase [Pseudonocardiales bacterium]
MHRPRYDDWSLPKGKLGPPESLLAAAVREVGEELGATAGPRRRLGTVRYEVEGVRKDVTFWAMQYLGGSFAPSDEVDEMMWLRPADARAHLTYATDRSVLDSFAELPPPESAIILVRHAKAGKRSDWGGSDADRPLDPVGHRQAAALVGFLSCFGVDRVISADRARCIETVEPFARGHGLSVEVDPMFSDESFVRSPAATQTALLALAKPGQLTVVCSQGLTIPSLIDRLSNAVVDTDTRKGGAWVLCLVDGDVLSADYYDDASGRH